MTGMVASTYIELNYGFPTPVPIFYITFGAGNGNFYMVSYNYSYKGLDGNCVRANGKIEVIGNTPMMIVNDNLYSCR